MTQERGTPSVTNLFWGLVFIFWGSLWLLSSMNVFSIPSDPLIFFFRFSPLLWVVLGLIILFHDDGKIEEIRP